jgi:beta-lactamase superfamily II metal-dependent hydrolase
LSPLNQTTAQDEIEVAVFGPGLGEAILIHCGNGQWICVDCAADDGVCWPLQYLQQMGLDPNECVRLIVATHWHADHVNRLSELLSQCSRAQFVCSAALRADEFKQIVARFSYKETGAARSPLAEVLKSFELLATKKRNRDASYKAPIFASAHHILDNFTAHGRPITVMALSPSAQDVLNALEAFAEYFVPIEQPVTGLSPIAQNHASVVVSVQIGQEVLLLLGGDLQKTSSHLTGWNAVIASTLRPQELSAFFKVPHHGSTNAQSDDVWQRMLVPSVHAAVTQFVGSGLPTRQQQQWLCSKSPFVFATGLPSNSNIRRRREVEKTIRESTRKFASRRLPRRPAVVRFRKTSQDGAWRVATFGEARRLT